MPDTEILPAAAEVVPATGVHVLRQDRCVVEISLRLLGRPVLRGRFAAARGTWTIGDELRVVLDPASLSTRIPVPNRMVTGGLTELSFQADEIDLFADRGVRIAGHVLFPASTRELRLKGDLRYIGDDCFVLWAAGTLPPSRRKSRLGPIARFFARRHLHVEVAIEFVR